MCQPVYRILVLFLFILGVLLPNAQAQVLTDGPTPLPVVKIGVFAPLYLDSAFPAGKYNYAREQFPTYTLQGLSFVQGSLMALKQYPSASFRTEAFFFDTKADSASLTTLIQHGALDTLGLQLIIGSVREKDFTTLATYSRSHQIPFISATYPNDGGIIKNPFLFIANSTLRTHCESVLSYHLQNNSNLPILHVRKAGSQEDRIEQYINTYAKQDASPLLTIKTLRLDSNFVALNASLDSSRSANVVFVGSMDEKYVTKLVTYLGNLPAAYNVFLIGMPNWENFSVFGSKAPVLKNEPTVHFTASYHASNRDSICKNMSIRYDELYKGSPDEFAMRGFETTYAFSRLLWAFPSDFTQHINDNLFSLTHACQFMPNLNATGEIDYYENKKLLFLKRKKGVTTHGW
ncbi:MAG: hypothetical protein ACKO5C_07765 [Ferruginibacter sp.]